jgi:hypothetical protein
MLPANTAEQKALNYAVAPIVVRRLLCSSLDIIPSQIDTQANPTPTPQINCTPLAAEENAKVGTIQKASQ